MFKKLTLENFKNFKEAELTLGPFTVLVGANATGKSNIREAFRFLHGIGRGYTLPEIIGENWDSSGQKIWDGIRGGTSELSYLQTFTKADETKVIPTGDFSISFYLVKKQLKNLHYFIKVAEGHIGDIVIPYVLEELLELEDKYKPIFHHNPYGENQLVIRDTARGIGEDIINQQYEFKMQEAIRKNDAIAFRKLQRQRDQALAEANNKEPLTQPRLWKQRELDSNIKLTLETLKSMRFPAFTPSAMRQPSFPGQTTLGAQGENLSSVLYAICKDAKRKQSLVEWVRELSPMDAVDFTFPPDQTGKIIVTLVEQDGRKISAYSASDGTLRLLGLLAALLGPEPAKFYFFEELENGIHPSRLHLLLELIEQVTAEGKIQVVATTHSPQLLGMVSEKTLEYAALTYRLEGQPDAHIQRIVDIPDAKEIFKEEDLSRLYEKGWLENSVHFMQNVKEPA